MLHYHGTPITPRETLRLMCPNNFCVSFAEPRDAEWVLAHGQSIMWDNGAYTAYTKGKPVAWASYYDWLSDKLFHPHWAVVPDVIGGTVEQNLALMAEWPHPKHLAAPVYHFGEPLDHLRRLAGEWPRIAIGGSVGDNNPGSEAWVRTVDAIWDEIEKAGTRPWVHMMRAHSVASVGRWPFASADSASWARNHAEYGPAKWAKIHEVNLKNPKVGPKERDWVAELW